MTKQEAILDWYQFSYLNGVRKCVAYDMTTMQERMMCLRDMGIISHNGQIEKRMIKLSKEMQELTDLLMKLVDQERKKDISLYLNDI